LKKNWEVISISTKKPKKLRFLKEVQYIYCDISDKKKLDKKLEKIDTDYVINFGGYVDHENILKTRLSHYIGCKNLATFFVKQNCKLFLQIGSSLEYGKLKSPHLERFNLNYKLNSSYSTSKLKATKFLCKLKDKYNFPCVILRPYLIYGPYQDFNRLIPSTINNCLKDKAFLCSSGVQKRDFLYIDDFVEGVLKIIYSKNKLKTIINIGSQKPISVKNVVVMIRKIIKKGKPIFGKILMRKDEISVSYPDINYIKKHIKWKPNTTLEKGLKLTIKSYKNK
jgi:nucleoside-diphosphate-sugar epimerase